MRERASKFNPEEDPLQEKVDQELEDRKIKKLTRREALAGLLAIGATAATAGIAEKLSPLTKATHKAANPSTSPEARHPSPVAEHKPIETKAEPQESTKGERIAMGVLAGRMFGNLYSFYTGIEGRVPMVATINFPEQIKLLTQKKQEYVDRHKKTNTVFKTASKVLLKEYETKDRQLTTLPEYAGKINQTLEETYKKLNWDHVGRELGLDASRLDLLRQISESMNAQDLLAYALTELMPSHDGQLNKHVLDFLLRHAGERYINSIPALSDDMASFGPYQFTSFALFDTGHERHGASVINQALPKQDQLPGSMIKLRESDHHKAAYLFIIDNLGNLINHLKPAELQILSSQWVSHKPEIIKYIAAAHHAPTPALTAAEHWLASKMTEPFEDYCSKSDLREYALKTQANREALL